MAFVEYEITVKGKQKPNGLAFPNCEKDIRKMCVKLYNVPESEIEVKELE